MWYGQNIGRRTPIAVLAVALYAATAVTPDGGQVIIPPSSIAKPGDAGQRAHTNIGIFVPNGRTGRLQPPTPPGRHGAEPSRTTPISPTQGAPAGRQ